MFTIVLGYVIRSKKLNYEQSQTMKLEKIRVKKCKRLLEIVEKYCMLNHKIDVIN